MSKFEQKDNSGTLFVNDKDGNEARPDRSGEAMIDGVMYKMAGWVNTAGNGNKYLSVKFTPKNEVHKNGMEQVDNAVKTPPSRPQSDSNYLEDDIPF